MSISYFSYFFLHKYEKIALAKKEEMIILDCRWAQKAVSSKKE